MPRAKSHRPAQAVKQRTGDNQRCGVQKPVPEFVSRNGTGSRHHVKKWPSSKVTHRQVKLVTPTKHPDKKMVFVVGASHLRALVDGFVTLPEGPVSFGFLSSPGAVAADLRMEVTHTVLPWTPDLVCLCAPGNDLSRPIREAAADFSALLMTVCNRWPQMFVLDFPPRLNVAPRVQELLRQEFQRIAERMGIPYVSVAEHLPLRDLELWCRDGVHLSDTKGMPVLARVLWDAAVEHLPPPSPVPSVSPPVSPPRPVVTGHSPVLRHKDAFKWTVDGREGGPGAIPVQQCVPEQDSTSTGGPQTPEDPVEIRPESAAAVLRQTEEPFEQVMEQKQLQISRLQQERDAALTELDRSRKLMESKLSEAQGELATLSLQTERTQKLCTEASGQISSLQATLLDESSRREQAETSLSKQVELTSKLQATLDDLHKGQEEQRRQWEQERSCLLAEHQSTTSTLKSTIDHMQEQWADEQSRWRSERSELLQSVGKVKEALQVQQRESLATQLQDRLAALEQQLKPTVEKKKKRKPLLQRIRDFFRRA